MRFSLLALLICLWVPSSLNAKTILLGVHYNYANDLFRISATREGYSNYLPVTACPDLQSEKLNDIQRLTMDIMVICNAVKKSGFADGLKLIPYPNVARGLRQSIDGQTHMVAQTLFKADHLQEKHVIVSKPVIRNNEFQVGFFTTRNRHEILKARNLEDFRKLKAVTVSSWKTDHNALLALGIEKIVFLPKRSLIARFIHNRRADFTLSYLKEPILTRLGGQLVRIPNVKLSFEESRSFLIPEANADLAEIINNYISQLRAQQPDALREAYIHAGFITEEYEHWLDLGKNN